MYIRQTLGMQMFSHDFPTTLCLKKNNFEVANQTNVLLITFVANQNGKVIFITMSAHRNLNNWISSSEWKQKTA